MNHILQLSSVIFKFYRYFKTMLSNRTFHQDGTGFVHCLMVATMHMCFLSLTSGASIFK